MGTRSLTYLYNKSFKLLLKFYLQFDGYPSGWGRQLSEILREHGDGNLNDLIHHIIQGGREEQSQYAQVLDPREPYSYGEEWEYHIYHDRVVVIDLCSSEKNYTANWRTSDFEDLCTRLGYGEHSNSDSDSESEEKTDSE